MRRIRFHYLAGGAVMVVTGFYFFVYLWRWEWNRALIVGVLFVATEVGLGVAVVLERLRKLGDNLASPQPSPEVLERVREAAPPPRDHFEWLSPKEGRFGVFVPVLMGMGVVASLLAWMVERVARATAGPVLERGLAAKLAPLAWPEGGLTGHSRRGPGDPLAGMRSDQP